jgi:hypothetical protein
MEVEKWEDSPMSGDRRKGDFVVGDVVPVDRTHWAELDQSGKLASIR